ncbi:MAG TPA: Abi family protein, partial [Dokdonella sp.]|nr:Abi family protein [Dokdonella sp.]
AGTDFNDVAGLYIFDRKLRLLVLDAIERIEVAIRTAITYEIAHAYGAFGHSDPGNFAPGFEHGRFMDELGVEERRAKETFANHFRKKYTSESHLPVWMATELLSFGTVSKLYGALAPALKQKIATEYGVDEQFLRSWLHALTYLRNVCAHHKRLWNRQFAIRPRFPSRNLAWPHQVPDNSRLYGMLVVLRHMLRVASPGCQWRQRLWVLLDTHPEVPLDAMKIPADWRGRNLWR